MSYATKPSWLADLHSLKETVQHHLFLPKDISHFTSLPDATAFNNGLKQFLFWKQQIMPSLKEGMVYLAFLGPKGLVPPNIVDITLALQTICDLKLVLEFYQGANTNFFALTFSSPNPVKQILANFSFYKDSIVLAVTHNSSTQHHFRLRWLPPMFELSRVHHLLKKYTKTHYIKKDSIGFAGGTFVPTNVISGYLTLDHRDDISSLPHLIQLPTPHKGCALLTIDGRPPLCLKCKEIGHTRQKCQMVKCVSCLKVHFPSSPCGFSSYSSVASKNITASTEEDWLLRLQEDNAISDSDPINHYDTDTSHPENSSPLPIIPNSNINNNFSLLAETPVHCSSPNLSECDPSFSSTALSSPIVSSESDPLTLHLPVFGPVIPPSMTARSHIITYDVASKSSAPAIAKKHSSSDALFSGTIFGDPDSEHFLSSDVDSSTEEPSNMDTIDTFHDNHSTRKRKNTPSSPSELDHISPPLKSTPDMLPAPLTTLRQSSSQHIDNIFSSEDISASSIIGSPIPRSTLCKTKSTFHRQIADFLSAGDEQLFLLESLCPAQVFTSDIVKIIKLLSSNGIRIHHLISSPQVLRLRFLELKKKIKLLQTQLGTFTIEDIYQYGNLEDKLLAGSSISPAPFFK